jgi:hypothetical protein
MNRFRILEPRERHGAWKAGLPHFSTRRDSRARRSSPSPRFRPSLPPSAGPGCLEAKALPASPSLPQVEPAPAPVPGTRFRLSFGLVLVLLALLGFLFLVAGCSTPTKSLTVFTGSYRPTNIQRAAPTLPESMRRLAVLPMVFQRESPNAIAGTEMLEPVLEAELAKTKKFEIVVVTPEALRQITGELRWAAEDPLPQPLLQKLKQEFGCDAVLFRRLTVYRPYPPLAIGWSLKLVDAQNGKIWWAADEVFDADQPSVVIGARRYQQQIDFASSPADDSARILNSPQGVGPYAARALLATLPDR